MASIANYSEEAPERSVIDALPGVTLIEFGVDWCPHCQGAQGYIAAALQACPDLRYLKFEDGPGRRLGRSFRIKLWPTLIVMRDGQETGCLVRPGSAREISELLGSA